MCYLSVIFTRVTREPAHNNGCAFWPFAVPSPQKLGTPGLDGILGLPNLIFSGYHGPFPLY